MLRFLFIFFYLVSVNLGAESARTCRIFNLEPSRNSPREAFLFDGTNSQKVALPSQHFSKVIKLPSGTLNLSLSPAEVHSSEELSPETPQTVVPEELNDFYLILAKDPDNEVLPVEIFPVQTNPDLKPGETLWTNLTTYTCKARLGNHTVVIASMDQTISPAPLKKGGYYQAQFLYRISDSEEFRPIMTKSWWCDPTSPYLGFVLNRGSHLPKIFSIRDHRPK